MITEIKEPKSKEVIDAEIALLKAISKAANESPYKDKINVLTIARTELLDCIESLIHNQRITFEKGLKRIKEESNEKESEEL